MKTGTSKINLYWRISVGVIVIWALGLVTALRLPYLYTDLAFKLQAYVVFPIILCAFGYFAFIYKSKKAGGKTGYQSVMDGLPSKRERIKRTLVFIFGFPAVSAGLAWSFIEVPIWAAELTASTPFVQTYTIAEIKHRSGPLWSAVFLLVLFTKDSESVDLQLNRWHWDTHPWKVGDVICVRGRTSMFGTIMETATQGVCL